MNNEVLQLAIGIIVALFLLFAIIYLAVLIEEHYNDIYSKEDYKDRYMDDCHDLN